MSRSTKVMVAMPAFNSERNIAKSIRSLPSNLRANVLVGDNASTDGTRDAARSVGAEVLTHEKNLGYGGNLKRLYRELLSRGAEIIIEVHSDNQYEPSLANVLVDIVAAGHFDVIQGNRIRSRAESLAGGMPFYRYFGNRALTFFENVWFGINLGEWHSGMRAYRRIVLETLPLESYPNTHAFASDILMDCVTYGFRVAEVPVPVRYEKQSSSVNVPGLFAYAGRTVFAALKRPPWTRRPLRSAVTPVTSDDDDSDAEEPDAKSA